MAVRNDGAAEGRTHESPPLTGAITRIASGNVATTPARPRLVAAILVLSTAAILTADAFTPRGYVVSSLYVVIVLFSGALLRPAFVTATAVGTIGFTTMGYFLKAPALPGYPPGAPIFTRVITCLGITLATGIVWVILGQARATQALDAQLRRTERDAQARVRMLAVASEITPIGTWAIYPDDSIEWSDTTASIFGEEPGTRPTEELLVRALGGDDPARLNALIEQARVSGEPFRDEISVTVGGGETRWAIVLCECTPSPEGGAFTLHGTVQDITRWRTAEHSATTLSHRFAQFAAIMPVIIWTADAQGRIEYFNEALTRYAGPAEGELLGDEWVEAVDPRDLGRVKAAWSHSIRTGEPYNIEYRVKSSAGTFEWHHLVAQAERDDAGSIVRWWGTSVNVHPMRILREQADALAAERESILESMLDGVYALDHDWVITYVNPSAERILGRASKDAVGQCIWDLLSAPVEQAVRKAMNEAMYQRSPAHVKFYSERIDLWLDVSITPSAAGVNAFFKDVTVERRLAEHLAQSQRLESVGQLTGGIAHDFNNLLTVVLGGADALLADDRLTHDAKETATLIATAAERGAELTHRLLAFARRQPLQPRAVDLTDRLLGMSPLLRRTLGEDIAVWVTGEPTPLAEVDPGQFDNALLNLCINSRDAMPDGGKLTVEAAPATLDEAYAAVHADVEPGDYVRVTVTDSGAGIDAQDLVTLFDPFFTTKGAGKGSGLGLAMVWGFVKQTKGHIAVYSEVGLGTSISMYLPLAAGPLLDDGHMVATKGGERGAGLVLVAEDDDLVRRFAADQLRAHGYDVIEAASGPDALALLDDVIGVDLLFTDVIMPGGMTGRHLADAVAARVPGVPVLFASGYTENVIVHNGRLDEGVRLLAKPYTARQLLSAVSQALATSEAPR